MSNSSTDNEPDESTSDIPGSSENSHCEILLDRFELLELIGEGGMGEVWCAHDLILDRMVAVKRITSRSFNESDVIRFQREAKAASTVDHSNVIQMLDFGMADSQPYMVMEYVEGITLSDLIQTQGAQDVYFALEIVAQTLDGIAAVHKADIVHRDLKAGNVMVLSKDIDDRAAPHDDIHVKILDFGIAKSIDLSTVEATLTKKGAIVGTPRYMSPEQAQGTELDQRSDLYSIGCIAFELLTGLPVFSGDTAIETISMHIDRVPPALKSKKPDGQFSEELEKLIARALAKNPSDRFRSAEEMAGQVRLIQDALPVPLVRFTFDPELKINIKEEKKIGRAAKFLYAGVAVSVLVIAVLCATLTVEISAEKTKEMGKPSINLDYMINEEGMSQKVSDLPKLIQPTSPYVFARGNEELETKLHAIAKSKSHPSHFVLNKCAMTEEYMKGIVLHKPNKLELWQCTGITPGVAEQIAQCESMVSLDLDESEISVEALSCLQPLNVRTLSLRDCNLTDAHLRAVAKMSIWELNATENKNLNEASFAILKRPQGQRLKLWINGWSVPEYSPLQIMKLDKKYGLTVTAKPFRRTSDWFKQLQLDEGDDEGNQLNLE